jgi:3-oxoacyl-[acyl-carrier-protein] synthase-3
MAQRCLVIGSETLSREDDHDRDSMIYSDGLALNYRALMMIQVCFPMKAALMPWMKLLFIFGKSYNPNLDPDTRYIKMHGRKIYEFF